MSYTIADFMCIFCRFYSFELNIYVNLHANMYANIVEMFSGIILHSLYAMLEHFIFYHIGEDLLKLFAYERW